MGESSFFGTANPAIPAVPIPAIFADPAIPAIPIPAIFAVPAIPAVPIPVRILEYSRFRRFLRFMRLYAVPEPQKPPEPPEPQKPHQKCGSGTVKTAKIGPEPRVLAVLGLLLGAVPCGFMRFLRFRIRQTVRFLRFQRFRFQLAVRFFAVLDWVRFQSGTAKTACAVFCGFCGFASLRFRIRPRL